MTADEPVWALVNKSDNSYVTTKEGLRTFDTRADARSSRTGGQKVVKLIATDASYSYR